MRPMGVEEFIFPSSHFIRVGLLVGLTSDRLAYEVAAYVDGTFCNPRVRVDPSRKVERGEETVRIISARKATPRERRTYEQNQKKGS